MNMLMSERYANGTTEYRLPTGAANCPIDYKDLWGRTSEDSEKDAFSSPNSGVFANVGTKTAPTSAANGGPGSVGSGKPPPSNASQSPFKVTDGTSLHIPYNSPIYMYKPFSDAIAQALEAAKAENFPPITITSTYRSPELQLYLKQNPSARAKKANGDPVAVAEPWSSLHQYGMAIDIKIDGNNQEHYRRFASLCGPNVLWGQLYNGDYVHFEWKSPGLQGSGKTSLQANKFRRVAGFGDEVTASRTSTLTQATPSGKSNYLQAVWKQFSAMEQQVVAAEEAATPPSGVIESFKSYFTSSSNDTGTGDATVPEDCKYAPLTQSGMAEINRIGSKLRSAEG